VRFYRTFSPLPTTCAAGGLIFCGTFRRPVFQLTACVYPNQTDLGYAASRPVEFGLSSTGEPAAILHPSKTNTNIPNACKTTSQRPTRTFYQLFRDRHAPT